VVRTCGMGPGEGLPRATARRAGWIARSRPWDGTEADFTVGLGIGPPPPFLRSCVLQACHPGRSAVARRSVWLEHFGWPADRLVAALVAGCRDDVVSDILDCARHGLIRERITTC
jgi:hypothetical protein